MIDKEVKTCGLFDITEKELKKVGMNKEQVIERYKLAKSILDIEELVLLTGEIQVSDNLEEIDKYVLFEMVNNFVNCLKYTTK